MNDMKRTFQCKVKQSKDSKSKKNIRKMFPICLCIVMLALIIRLFIGTVNSGATALTSSYKQTYTIEKDITYQNKYDNYKEAAEERFHVSNKASIYVGKLKEEQKLEVLEVSDVEFIIEDQDDNSGNVTAWLEVPGKGTFVVDMEAGEYIIDVERANVLVRVPYPELCNVRIDYANVQKMLFRKEGILNGNHKEGEKIAEEQYDKAYALINREFVSNQNYHQNAMNAAKSTIEALIKQLNPEVDNLTVEVEFY